jgi:hypothetical protein
VPVRASCDWPNVWRSFAAGRRAARVRRCAERLARCVLEVPSRGACSSGGDLHGGSRTARRLRMSGAASAERNTAHREAAAAMRPTDIDLSLFFTARPNDHFMRPSVMTATNCPLRDYQREILGQCDESNTAC